MPGLLSLSVERPPIELKGPHRVRRCPLHGATQPSPQPPPQPPLSLPSVGHQLCDWEWGHELCDGSGSCVCIHFYMHASSPTLPRSHTRRPPPSNTRSCHLRRSSSIRATVGGTATQLAPSHHIAPYRRLSMHLFPPRLACSANTAAPTPQTSATHLPLPALLRERPGLKQASHKTYTSPPTRS